MCKSVLQLHSFFIKELYGSASAVKTIYIDDPLLGLKMLVCIPRRVEASCS